MNKDSKSTDNIKASKYKLSDATKKAQSQAKKGVNHPKFEGYYICYGIAYTSAIIAAKVLGTYPNTVRRRCHDERNIDWSFVKAYKGDITE